MIKKASTWKPKRGKLYTMPRRLRVFVSSTMKDLVAERTAVRRRLQTHNFEPVLAEGLMPTGQGSWGTICNEIQSCDVVVLILGPSYGWVPTAGPQAGRGLAITELEVEYARTQSKVVIPFIQDLPGIEDADRKAFRQRIEAWDDGLFRTTFASPSDLASKVARSLIELLTDSYIRPQFLRSVAHTAYGVDPGTVQPLPPALVQAVVSREAVILVGAGVSLTEGLPAASAFTEAMIQRIRAIEPGYELPSASGVPFYSAATDLELLSGPQALYQLAEGLVDPPFLGGVTPLHEMATKFFDLVLTTNYDALLERAAPHRRVVWDDSAPVDLAGPAIVKLAGSIQEPTSLVLTELDLARIDLVSGQLRKAVAIQLSSRPLIAVGTSLRDPAIVSLLETSAPLPPGWAVADAWSPASERRLVRWNLQPLRCDAASFFASLTAATSGR